MSTPSFSPLLPLRLILLGYGHVAQAFLPLLASRSEWLARNAGVHTFISGIGSRSNGFYVHPFGFDNQRSISSHELINEFKNSATRVENAESFIRAGKSAGASLLIELTSLNPQTGEPALTHIRTALGAGMDVITANKGPVAYAQAELQKLALQQHVQFCFEATVMDGFPLFNLAQFSLPSVGIRSFRALLNSTSSLVLSSIESNYSLSEAIQHAQYLGIAESDPWYDLDGWDAVMKTTILANTLLNGQLTPHSIKRKGIRDLSIENIRRAANSGTPLRLVSTARREDGVIVAEVRPEQIAVGDILHVGQGSTSVITLDTDAMGTMTLVEHEPTVLQTAYGILSDLITILRFKR